MSVCRLQLFSQKETYKEREKENGKEGDAHVSDYNNVNNINNNNIQHGM
tara:strand:+ start:466 stop:612 length:147 start_codon:yes stop_codon:yes gene_type:complete